MPPLTAPSIHLVDTHAHVDQAAFDQDRGAVVARALAAGVTFVQVAFEPEGWRRSLALAAEYPWLRVTLGLHPNDANLYSPAVWADLRQLLTANRALVVGLGETGLDYYRDWTTPTQQRANFAAHLELAREFDLPLVVHNREADADVIACVREFGAGTRGVMHCFSGSSEMLEQSLALGYYISIAGPVTFKQAQARHEAARAVPLDRLLLESDCPYLTPVPYRGRRNEPAYLTYTAAAVAELRGISLATLAAATTANAYRLFSLPEGQP